ncbi:MAG TPA: phosphoglycerate dehydrogenase [Candidatus Methylomirabilis sp.]|jgi:D-3-phosphoglycerate dehydrogenase
MGVAVIVVPDDFPVALAGTPALTRLKTMGRVIHHETRPADAAELARRIAGAAAVMNIRAYSKFTADLLARCPTLRLISVWGTGTDHVDLEACRRRGVAVTNTPGANALAVAEHTMALMLAAARQIPRLDRETRQGMWPRGLGVQLHGKTLGILGLGAIGRHVAGMARALEMRVVAWTYHPEPGLARQLGVDLLDFERVLAESDILTVHVRQTDEATGLLGPREIARMKRGAILVNTARGPIVDRAALLEALRSGHLGAAGLDVFDVEPVLADDPLVGLPQVVLTPHCAGMVPEAILAGLEAAVDNVAQFLAGNPATYVVPPPAAP